MPSLTRMRPDANSAPEIERRVQLGRITWVGPLLVMMSRSALMLVAQGLVAALYLFCGHAAPWNAAAPWWTVYGTIVDLGCLALMLKFTRAEGIRIRDLIGRIRWRWGHDLLVGLVCLMAYLPLFSLPGLLAAKVVYGVTHPPMYPGLLAQRTLPGWAVIYSFSLFLLVWSPTEEMTYNGYALPRILALSRRKLMAIPLVGFWFTMQHCFIPFILDWKYVIWRFLFFLPGCLIISLIYLRLRRLAPLILAHWTMDSLAVFYTLNF